MATFHRIGVDENGLGARLGPLVVTAVLASVDERGAKLLGRRLPKRIAEDLADSKQLLSHHDFELGEAWARALVPQDVSTPAELFEHLSHERLETLRAPCPTDAVAQCWRELREDFSATPDTVERLRGHLRVLQDRGVHVQRALSVVVCTKRLNEARALGKNRFISDLNAMEQLVISLQKHVGADVYAVCGKVGGMAEYGKFFGPLAGWLHVAIEQGRKKSSYRFPGLGELHFLRDADATDPLVMLASLVGKYVRELLMQRISSYYPAGEEQRLPSGYHDPVTRRFVEATALTRQRRGVPSTCFERDRDVS